MQRVVRIAPLLKLPVQMSTFDYAWCCRIEPQIGAVVEIQFRRRLVFGVVVAIGIRSKFVLKEISEQEPQQLLSKQDIMFVSEIARRVAAPLGALLTHMVPKITKRTVESLLPQSSFSHRRKTTEMRGPLKYVWYSTAGASQKALEDVVIDRMKYGPVAIVAATQEIAATISKTLKTTPNCALFELRSDQDAARRALWSAWVGGKHKTLIIGTHLVCWLPHAANSTFIIVESSHQQHEQWVGSRYTNRQLLEARRIFFGDTIMVLDHSPDTTDLDRVSTLPTVPVWPTVIDRKTDEPVARVRQYAPTLDENLHAANRVLFFVTHLKTATHQLCRDCGTLFAFDTAHLAVACAQCHSTRLSDIGYGGKKLAAELLTSGVVNNKNDIALLDVANLRAIDGSTLPQKIIIATLPLYDRLDLTQFDLIIDLTTDFELLHPEFDSEERLWKRIRATATRLGSSWRGTWFVETRHPELSAWGLATHAGFAQWWQREQPLRKRFAQRPFNHLDFFGDFE